MFRLGLIVNPLAGLGGSVGLKGSDGKADEALKLGATPKSNQRTQTALEVVAPLRDRIQVVTCPGDMGEDLVKSMGFSHSVLPMSASTPSSAEDTRTAATMIRDSGVDLLLFAGGDGTARDICSVVEDAFPVLGIPAGVKIHSGVYGITPTASGEVVKLLVTGQLVDLKTQDVRDIDEEAFRQSQVKAKLFGEMLVPQAGQFVQAVKQGGIEQEALVLDDLAAYLESEMEDDVLYLVGSGKTTQHFMDYMHLPSTLLGVDAVLNREVVGQDLTESGILDLLNQYSKSKMIVSVIGGQGHVFGRGNQQLSAEVIRRVGRANLVVLCTKTKLSNLNGKPLIVDTGDVELDRALAGHIEVLTGFNDRALYPIA